MKLNLTKKIMLMTGAVLVLSVVGIGLVSVVKSKTMLNELAKDELVKMAALSKDLCKVAAIQTQQKTESDIKYAALQQWSRGVSRWTAHPRSQRSQQDHEQQLRFR